MTRPGFIRMVQEAQIVCKCAEMAETDALGHASGQCDTIAEAERQCTGGGDLL